ncbi:c-type cytochrome [Thioclava marina]|nr:c-type cytochrome [Thioclava marina]
MSDKMKQDPRLPDETFEPFEESRRIPLPVYWIAIALAIWGVIMLVETSHSTQVADKERAAQNAQDVTATAPVTAEPAAAQGHALFTANCATCHGDLGAGSTGAVPPLAKSDLVQAGGAEAVVRIALRGIDGPIAVNGVTYNGHMPNFASALDDKQLAAISSHVATSFAGAKDGIEPTKVAELRKADAGKDPWAGGAELASAITGLPAQPARPAPAPAMAATQSADVETLVKTGAGYIWACASCHGDKGQGMETTPRLAGLPAAYIAKQLHDFQQGTRFNDSMAYVAKALSEEQIQALAAHYAVMRAPSTARPSLKGDLARGEQIAREGDWSIGVPACFTCHGPSGFGVAPDFPALAAQHPAYTARQLAMWAGGSRHNSPLGLMAGIGKALNDVDRRAVADYLASLAPVPATPKTELAAIDASIPVSEGDAQ